MIDPNTCKPYTNYGRTASGKIVDNRLGIRWDDFYKMVHKTPPPDKVGTVTDTTTLPPEYWKPPELKDIEVKPENAMPIKWQFTPWQKASQAYNASRIFNITKYPALRSQYEPKYVSLPLYNPEPAIRDTQATTAMAIAGANILNPILRNAAASDIIGKNLDQVNKIRSQYDNMNVGQKTSEEMTNNQLRYQSLISNINFDQQFYQQTVNASANQDKLRQVAQDQFWSGIFQDVATNQALAYGIASQRKPAWTFDWRTGDFIRLPKSILDVNAPNSKSSVVDSYLSKIDINSLNPDQKMKFINLLLKRDYQPTIASLGTDLSSKKGGVIKGNTKRNPYIIT
jgi:hypothetical protein